jgi:lipoyl-dependent peroxiredoxin
MKRSAKAHWYGDLKQGRGSLTTQNGVLNKVGYSFTTRFREEGKGTNPEDLLAAAYAGCFTMAVCSILTQKGLNAVALDTESTVFLKGSTITNIHLSVTAYIEELSPEVFAVIVKDAEKYCIISKALNIPVTSEVYCWQPQNMELRPNNMEIQTFLF